MNRTHVALACTAASVVAVAAALCGPRIADAADAKTPQQTPVSLEEARRTVSMLNDLYVNSVVLTHNTYVKNREAPASAVVARQVFKAMGEKGWPETRWLSTTGRPFNKDANPKDQFERDAVLALKKGEGRFERVVDGKLRVATLVPLVDASCGTCHTKDKVGDPIGGLSYTVQLTPQK